MAEPEAKLCFLWVFGREAPAWTKVCGIHVKPERAVFTARIREQLANSSADPAGQLNAQSSAAEWHDALAPMHNRILGAMLVQHNLLPDMMDILQSEERDLLDFYDHIGLKDMDSNVLFVKVIRRLVLQRPVPVPFLGHQRMRKMWFTLTRWTSDELAKSICIDQRPTQEVVTSWQNSLNRGSAFSGYVEGRAAAICVAHAALVLGGIWTSWGFPVTANKRRAGGLGLKVAADIIGPIAIHILDTESTAADTEDDPGLLFGPDTCQRVADTLRLLATQKGTNGSVPDDIYRRALQHVTFLQSIRDKMVSVHYRMSRRMHEIDVLIHALLVSAHLKSGSSLQAVVEHCLSIAVHDRNVRAHFLQTIAQFANSVPSRSALQRNRVTLHMGYCRMLARQHAALTDGGRGIIRWATMDESPQGHFQWMMQGSITMRADDVGRAFHMAQRLSNRVALGLDAATEKDIVAELSRLLVLRQGVPTAVGSGKMSLRHKMSAVTHSCRLQLNSWSETAAWITQTFSWTGDMGTESGVSHYSDNLLDMFGEWVRDADFDKDDQHTEPDFDYQEESPIVPDSFPDSVPESSAHQRRAYATDCRRSIYVPGLLHIIHNATADLQSVLAHWPAYVRQLKAVAKMLSKRKYRDRLIETCFRDEPQSAYVHDIEQYCHSVHDGRWGTVFAAVAGLVPLEAPLRYAWSSERYRLRSRLDKTDEGPETAQVQLVDSALSSNFFGAYTHMLDSIGESMLSLVIWCEACSCHGSNLEAIHGGRYMRRKAFQKLVAKGSCPLRCLRAPDLATGAAEEHLSELLRKGLADLVLHPTMCSLGEAERAQVVREYAAARRHLTFTFIIKLSCWKTCPWAFFGLAHHRVEKARRCAVHILQVEQSIVDWDNQHPLTQAFLRDPVLHDHLISFATGNAELDAFPELQAFVAPFRFALISERWIEGRHALAKRVLDGATNAGAVHLAFHTIMRPLQQMLTAEPTAFAELTEACRSRETGLHRHPTVARMVKLSGQCKAFRKGNKNCVAVLYHVDRETLFREMMPHRNDNILPGSSSAAAQLPQQVSASAVDGEAEALPGEALGGILHEKLLCRHMLEFLREVVRGWANDDVTMDTYILCLRLNATGSLLSRFVDIVAPRAQDQPDDSVLFHIEPELGGASFPSQQAHRAGDLEHNFLFFTIQHLNPSRAVTAKGAAKIKDSTHMAISKCDVLEVNRPWVRVALEPEGSVRESFLLLTPSSFPSQVLNSLRCWQRSEENFYDFGVVVPTRLRQAMQSVIARFISAPDGELLIRCHQGLPDLEQESVEHLAQHGLAKSRPREDDRIAWALTQRACDSLRISCNLKMQTARPVFRVRDLDELELSAYELHCLLMKDSWACNIKATWRTLCQPYRFGEAKIFWLRPNQVSFQPLYFVALLQAAKHKQEVPHFASNGVYKTIIDGHEPPSKRQRRHGVGAAVGDPISFDIGGRRLQKGICKEAGTRAAGVCQEVPGSANTEGAGSSIDGSDMSSDAESLSRGSAASSMAGHSTPGDSDAGIASAGDQVADDSAADMGAGGLARLMGQSVRWGPFLFTKIWQRRRRDVCCGMQVKCYIPGHDMCRKTANWGPHGGEELTIRKMKAWCLRGWDPDIEGQEHHVSCPLPEDPPTEEELDMALGILLGSAG